jgi:hypothetical protein
MPYDFLFEWGSWAATAGVGLAFITTMLVVAIQPKNTSKWFWLSFSFTILFVSMLCMLQGWHHHHKGDSQAAQTDFFNGGGWLFAFVLMFGISLSMAKEKLSRGKTPGRDACTRHARWLSVSFMVGTALPFLAFIFSADMPQGWNVLILLLYSPIFCGASYIIFVFGLPPRCPSCKNGSMRLKGGLPAWYCCQSCGIIIHTRIMLGRKGM